MKRNRLARLAIIADGLPSPREIEATVRQAGEARAYRRVAAGIATPADFDLLCNTPRNRDRLLKAAGGERYRFTRGLPSPDGPWKAAGLLVSWPLEEDPPPALLADLHEAAHPAEPAHRTGDTWEDANGLLAILGGDQGAGLRREYYRHLDRYDPQWIALQPEGGSPEQMVQRVKDGTADLRDHFFTHMPYLRLYRNALMVAAVGHRLARQAGETVYLTEPSHLGAALISYPPDEPVTGDLWHEIETQAQRPPTPSTIEDWREYNRCLVTLRYGNVDKCRAFLEENWSLYEAEYRYLTSRGELA
jgi:hypothetical protein